MWVVDDVVPERMGPVSRFQARHHLHFARGHLRRRVDPEGHGPLGALVLESHRDPVGLGSPAGGQGQPELPLEAVRRLGPDADGHGERLGRGDPDDGEGGLHRHRRGGDHLHGLPVLTAPGVHVDVGGVQPFAELQVEYLKTKSKDGVQVFAGLCIPYFVPAFLDYFKDLAGNFFELFAMCIHIQQKIVPGRVFF